MSIFKDIRGAMSLLKQVDLKQLSAISRKIDLGEAMKQLSRMDEKQLQGLMKMLSSSGGKKELPEINPDFYELSDKLTRNSGPCS